MVSCGWVSETDHSQQVPKRHQDIRENTGSYRLHVSARLWRQNKEQGIDFDNEYSKDILC